MNEWCWSEPIKLHILRKCWVSWTAVCQNPAASVTSHFIFSWFPAVVTQMLRWFPSSKSAPRVLIQPSSFKFIKPILHQLQRPFSCFYKWRNWFALKCAFCPSQITTCIEGRLCFVTQGSTQSELTCLFCELPGYRTLLGPCTASVFETHYQVIGLAPPLPLITCCCSV